MATVQSVPKIGLLGVIARGVIGVGITTLSALQIDPSFRATGHVSETTKGALLVVAGMSLLNFISQSITHYQNETADPGLVPVVIAQPVPADVPAPKDEGGAE